MAKRAPKLETEHVHKLQRHKYANGTKIFFCVLDCDYKIEAVFALGKRSICHICGGEFTMNEYSVKLARPHCKECGKMKIITPEGPKFVSKGRPTQAIAEMGRSAVDSLKNRLSQVVTMERDEDKDI